VVIGRTDLHGHLLDAANGRSLIGARVSADYLEAQPAEVRLLFPRDLLERFSSDLPTARLQSGNAFSNAFHSAIGSLARPSFQVSERIHTSVTIVHRQASAAGSDDPAFQRSVQLPSLSASARSRISLRSCLSDGL
jgi:hypothetical protein